MNKTYYEILNVDKNASADEIKKAYFSLAKKFHPDISHAKESKVIFAEIKEAYETLHNPDKRIAYDQKLTQETSLKPEEKKECTEKEKEILTYRRHIIIGSVTKIILSSVIGIIIGYFFVLALSSIAFKNGNKSFLEIFSILGGVSGFLIGFFWSLDAYFKVETFINSTVMKQIFQHFRTIAFTLSFTYLFAILINAFSNILKSSAISIKLIIIFIAIIFAATFSSHGEIRLRLKSGFFLEIFVILIRNITIGVLGGILGFLLGGIFWIIIENTSIIIFSTVTGAALSIIIGASALSDLQYFVSLINNNLKKIFNFFVISSLLSIGIIIGFILTKIFDK